MIIKSLKGKSRPAKIYARRKNKKIIKIGCEKMVKFPLKGNIFAPTFY